jgi:hypothetical protein
MLGRKLPELFLQQKPKLAKCFPINLNSIMMNKIIGLANRVIVNSGFILFFYIILLLIFLFII